MITIHINHAFNGFLYAPLFLASDLGLFPECATLKYRNGDSECLDKLCDVNGGPAEEWFAICDPFSVPDLATKVHEAGDQISVVGCMVGRLPMWLYNPSNATTKVSDENALKNFRAQINSLTCYKESTTGYLIGKRLQDILEISNDELYTEEFGEEFSTTRITDEHHAVLTSDILRAVKMKDEPNSLVFNYPSFSPEELRPFLFTGILTLRQNVVDKNLWAVLGVLAGIKKAIQLLKEENVQSKYISILKERFEPDLVQMGVSDPIEQETLIRDAVKYAFRTMDLYDIDLEPDEDAWNNANNEWERVFQRKRDINAVMNYEPIPSLLLSHDWKTNPRLRDHMSDTNVNARSMLQSKKIERTHLMIFFLMVLSFFPSAYAFTNALGTMTKSLSQNSPAILVIVVALGVLCYSVYMTYKDFLRLNTQNLGLRAGTVFITAFGAIWGSVSSIS